eukprot:3193980-Rhodomonas_salina.2
MSAMPNPSSGKRSARGAFAGHVGTAGQQVRTFVCRTTAAKGSIHILCCGCLRSISGTDAGCACNKAASEILRHMPALSSIYDMEHVRHLFLYASDPRL